MSSLRTASQSTPLQRLHLRGLVRRVTGAAKTSLALVGLGTVLYWANEYNKLKKVDEYYGRDDDIDAGVFAEDDAKMKTKTAAKKKKRVLVLPFHQMKIVERKKFDFSRSLRSLTRDREDDDGRVVEVEAKELVDAIHEAASDPNIVALYGVFGHGFGFTANGYAQLEEIRNAIRVFNESHRVHMEPNRSYDPDKRKERPEDGTPKPSYAYADTFGHPLDSGNKEYYLASQFSHIHLQPQGELNLFGLAKSNTFLRSAFDKYGIKVHVFKHGKYKNAPNEATEKGYTKEHLENTKSIVTAINDKICEGIVQSRSLYETFKNKRVWDAIHNYGTMTALNAKEVGLVDYLPRIDPRSALLFANKNEKTREEVKKKWNDDEVNFDTFTAAEPITLSEYTALLKKRREAEKRRWKIYDRLKHLAEKSSATALLLSSIGYGAPHFNIDKDEYAKVKGRSSTDKIALVNVDGLINDALARKITSTLRKIKKDKDVKCVVLRVDSSGGSMTASETIYQECKDLPQPVICSMGNVAASGGYYVVTDCDRIFALPTTITGSIGVFGIKLDLNGLAAQYGVKVQHVTSGSHSSTMDPFQPLTRKIKMNLNRNVDRYYEYFKTIVASGRGMSLDQVQTVAQGRVWTGEQAKQVGLVDELGGLSRAIAYANNTYTNGDAEIEVWPKRPSFREILAKLSKTLEEEDKKAVILNLLRDFFWTGESPGTDTGVRANSDHWRFSHIGGTNQLYLDEISMRNLIAAPVPESVSGIWLTMDDSDALRLTLRNVSQRNLDFPPSFWV